MSEMGRCRDCRWWNAQPERLRGLCGKLVTVGYHAEELAQDVATIAGVIVKGTQVILTGPDFGCVQFEVKE